MQSQERPVHHDQRIKHQAARNRRRRTRLGVEQHRQRTVAAQQDKVRQAANKHLALQRQHRIVPQGKVRRAANKHLALQHQHRIVPMDQLLVSKATALHATAWPRRSRVETTEYATPQVSRATALHAMALRRVIAATVLRTGSVPIITEIIPIIMGTTGIIVMVGGQMDQELVLPITAAMAIVQHQRIAEEHQGHSSGRGMDKHHSERLVARIVDQDKGHMAHHSALAASVPVVRAIDQAQDLQITITVRKLKSVAHPWSKRNQRDRSRCRHRSS